MLRHLLMEISGLNPNVEDIKYNLRYPKENKLIKLNIDKVLKLHKKHEPEFSIDSRKSNNVISQSRFDNAKEYWKKYSLNQKWLRPDGTRSLFDDMFFEPSIVMFDNKNKFGFIDGRHRLIAMKELGYTTAMFEIPKEQQSRFKQLT